MDRLRKRLRLSSSDSEHSIPEARELQEAANLVLGLQPIDQTPWKRLRETLGWTAEPGMCPAMTAPRLSLAFDHLARESGRTPTAFRRVLRMKLVALRERADVQLAEATAAEVRIAEEMQAERDRAATATLFASDSPVVGIQRAEQHLTRQLERQLALFDRLRARRKPSSGQPGGHAPGFDRTTIGFVFPARSPLPPFAGHPDRVLDARDLEPEPVDRGPLYAPRTAFEPPHPVENSPCIPQDLTPPRAETPSDPPS